MNQNPYRQYQKTQVMTASKEKILLMLYEGAIRFTKQAKIAMEEKKIAEKGKFISKANAIVSELMATLDFGAGGEIASDLENLYVFMIDKLIEGNIKNDIECLNVVERLLLTLYEAWKDVIENPRPDGVASQKIQTQIANQQRIQRDLNDQKKVESAEKIIGNDSLKSNNVTNISALKDKIAQSPALKPNLGTPRPTINSTNQIKSNAQNNQTPLPNKPSLKITV